MTTGLLQALARSERGASAAEFALILPLLVLFLLGIVDLSMWKWMENRADKATQAAVRHAAVIDYVAGGLEDISFAGQYGSGNPIPAGAVPEIVCRQSGCSPSSVGGGTVALDPVAFAAVVAKVQGLLPEATAGNVIVRYEHVGLGYAGNPAGSDVAPIVTVEIENIAGTPLFNPIFLDLFWPNAFRLTGIRSSMPMEDGAGNESFSS